MNVVNKLPPTDEEKAETERLRAKLKKLCQRIPAGVINGSYLHTLDWKAARKKYEKSASKPGISDSELRSAIYNMEKYFNASEPSSR